MLDSGWTSSFYLDGREQGYAKHDNAIFGLLTAPEHDTQYLMHIAICS